MSIGRRGLLLMVFLVALAIHTVSAQENIDPHDNDPANCIRCHTRIPTPEEAADDEWFLVRDTIDGTCHLCHPYDCCRINSLKGHNHPSNVNRWDVEDFTEPRNLPLHQGLITCNTCHYHLRPSGEDHRMVRIVRITLRGVDWSALCLDCHVGY